MSKNLGQYCLVDTEGVDSVVQGPQVLPQNLESHYNINNTDVWNDPALLMIGWYPYILIDPGSPGAQYNRSLDPFVINATDVEQTAVYTPWTQEQIDKGASITVEPSQIIATSLASQTDRIVQENESRKAIGADPSIPLADETVVTTYLKDMYDAVDDPANPVSEPPGATRQETEYPGEQVDRGVIRRSYTPFGGFDYQVLTYTLYSNIDATGMAMKVHRGDGGIYLSTFNLAEVSPGIWEAQTNLNGEFLVPDKAYDIVLFKGVDISQKRTMAIGVDELIFDVRWSL